MPFSRMNGWLEEAKLGFACSANLIDHVGSINLSVEQQQLLNEIPDSKFRETVRDFVINQQFRKDYWVRGPRPLTPVERLELLRRQRFVLAVAPDKVTMTVGGPRGEATLQEAIYRPILEQMADHRPRSLTQLEAALASSNIPFSVLQEAMTILVAKMAVYPAQDEDVVDKASAAATRLNRKLCEQARYSDQVAVLASPVTGGGISHGQVDKLLMLARANGIAAVEDTARFVIDTLKLAGRRLAHKDGKVPGTPEAEMDEAIRIVQVFDSNLAPMLKALRIEC